MIDVLRSSFTGGEWSSTFWARNDIQKYDTACRYIENWLPHPGGKMLTRFGSKFIAAAKYPEKESLLIRFQFSVVQLYFIELGDHYMRFYKDDELITYDPKVVTGITSSSPCVVTSVGHGFSNGDYVVISEVAGMPRLNGEQFIVSNVTANTFSLKDIDGNYLDSSSNYGSYVSGGKVSKIYEIASPYAESEIWNVRFDAQSADVLYLNHPSYPEKQLTRTGHTSWAISSTDIGAKIQPPSISTNRPDGNHQFCVTSVSGSGEESVISNVVNNFNQSNDVFTLSWGGVAGADYYNVYMLVDGFPQYYGRAKGTSFTITEARTPDSSKGPPQYYNPFSGAGNYPAFCGFYQQRLMRARTNSKPSTLFGSQIPGINNFDRHDPVEASDAFDFAIAQTLVQELQWMLGFGKRLFLGTTAYEYMLAPSSSDQAVSATNVSGLDQPIGNIGSCSLPGMLVDNSVLFVNSSRQKIYDQSYVFTDDAYKGSDLTYFAEHLFRDSGIKQYVVRRNPFTIVHAIRYDGVLCGMTYLKDQSVWGWFREKTDGTVEAISASDDRDGFSKVYMIVKRTINGKTRRYVEAKVPRPAKCDPRDEWCSDCASVYEGSATTVVTGLDYLEGKAVAVNADGNLVFDLVVTNGSITLPNAASKVIVGLPYTCRFETTDLDVQTPTGWSVAKSRTLNKLLLRLENTRECFVGTSGGNVLYPLKIRKSEDWGMPTQPFDGDLDHTVDPCDPKTSRVIVEVRSPAPCTILSLFGDLEYAK